MKKLFLVCNAHLDPVWLWDWQEGATAALSTFRVAADFCKKYEGFVFCHNEALLYQWVEEYEPELFHRIQKLVADGKWCIIGGWFLQPDCNMPSGESILRQIRSGREYFRQRFHAEPKIAVNFDSFGHNRGLVQILKQCGYTGYLFMRPEKEKMALPARNFLWQGYDGSEILAHRLDRSYRTLMGQAVEDITDWCCTEAAEEISLFTWGIGNHGGGPSQADLEGLNEWMRQQTELDTCHGTLEAFFGALECAGGTYPTVAKDLHPVHVGCYTSQAKLKRLHRQLENRLYATEKLLSAAASQGLIAYPGKEVHEAERDLLFCQFHDILPGTSILEGETASIATMHHGLDILSRLQMKGAMALLAGQEKARPGETPVFIYNPHPYPVTGAFTFEIMPAEQNWSRDVRNVVTVTRNGETVLSQEEKPSLNMNLDWRKRITVQATLDAASMNRFDCAFQLLPNTQQQEIAFPTSNILFDNGRMQVLVNVKTGLIDRYAVDGVDYLCPGALSPVAYADNPDPWHMDAPIYPDALGAFTLAEPKPARSYFDGSEVTAFPVRIVEDGPIRMIVEAELIWKSSRIIQSYLLPKTGTSFEVSQHIIWNEADTMLKLEIPAAIDGRYIGQGMFGSGELAQDGTECVSQKWCGLFDRVHGLTIANTGVYGSHCKGNTVSLSLLRSPGYACHPIEDRRLVHEERFIPRMDQGEHRLNFVICGGSAAERRRLVDFEAQVLNEAPFILSAFPSGNGSLPKQSVILSDPSVLLSAMYYDETNHDYIIRLWNTQDHANQVTAVIPLWNVRQEIKLNAFQFKTYRIHPDGYLEETSAVGGL